MKKAVLLFTLILILSFWGCMASGREAGEVTPRSNISATNPGTLTAQATSDSSDSEAPAQSETVSDTAQTSYSETETPITVDEISDGGTFYLGQSMSDVSSVFYDRGIEILQGSDDVLVTDGFEFSFFKGKVNEILVNAPSKIRTVKGLDFGDTVDRMTELYGTDYKRWELTQEFVFYEYTIGDHYFGVQFRNGGVDMWQLSTEKNIGG